MDDSFVNGFSICDRSAHSVCLCASALISSIWSFHPIYIFMDFYGFGLYG